MTDKEVKEIRKRLINHLSKAEKTQATARRYSVQQRAAGRAKAYKTAIRLIG